MGHCNYNATMFCNLPLTHHSSCTHTHSKKKIFAFKEQIETFFSSHLLHLISFNYVSFITISFTLDELMSLEDIGRWTVG